MAKDAPVELPAETTITITLTLGAIAGLEGLGDQVARVVGDVVQAKAMEAAERAIASVTTALGGTTEAPQGKPLPSARPPKPQPVETQAQPAAATKRPGRPKKSAASKGAPSDEEILAAVRQLQASDAAGPRKALLASHFGVEAKVLKGGTARLIAAGSLKTTGKKQGTRYLSTGK